MCYSNRMSYSIDLRKKVVKFVSDGATKREAARHFDVSDWCVRNWVNRKDISPKKHSIRTRKINKQELIQFVNQNNDLVLREYAEHFNVKPQSIWDAFKKLGIRKKNDAIQGAYVYKKD